MSGFTGTNRLVRLALRRDRITLPGWILGMAGFLAATTAMFENSYSKHPLLLEPDTRIVVENPGMRVLGLVTGPSVGGYTLHRDALTLAVLAAMMSVHARAYHRAGYLPFTAEELDLPSFRRIVAILTEDRDPFAASRRRRAIAQLAGSGTAAPK